MAEFVLNIKLGTTKEMLTSGDVARSIQRSVNVCMLKEGQEGDIRDLNGYVVGRWQVK